MGLIDQAEMISAGRERRDISHQSWYRGPHFSEAVIRY